MSSNKNSIQIHKLLTVHQERVLGAFMWTSMIGSDTLICPITVHRQWSEVQHVVFNVVGHVRGWGEVCHVEVHVVLHPVDHVIGPSNVTSESEVFRIYWNGVVSDHHWLYWLCGKKTQQKPISIQLVIQSHGRRQTHRVFLPTTVSILEFVLFFFVI